MNKNNKSIKGNFFAKFLPMEGPILIDNFVLQDNGVIFFYGDVAKNGVTHYSEPEIALNNLNNKKIAMLCLCCYCDKYDVKPGDVVRYLDGKNDVIIHEIDPAGYATIKLPKLNDKLMTEIPLPNLYKVIGEISPEAIWVQNGERIYEYEEWWYNTELKNSIMKKLNENWDKEIANHNHMKTILKIKNPSCQHFH